jgi:methyl-accepting chemotaxis protein
MEIDEMKRTVSAIGVYVLLLGGSLAFAQMNGGMMKDQSGTMHHDKMGEHHGMMEHGQMMSGMMDMSNQMAEMMGKMSGTMKDMPAGRMKMMSSAMNDMSHQLQEMSMAMGSGKCTAAEMQRMQERMTKIQGEMSGTEMHK